MEDISLRERVKGFLKDRREKVINGGINSIPSPFERFSNDFIGVEQGSYYLVTASTKVGKTQIASFIFVYNTLMYAYKHPDQLRVKIFYYSFEETKEDIMMRFMSHILYILSDYRICVSPTDLKSSKKDKIIDKQILDLLDSKEYDDMLKFFEEHIVFYTNTNPTGIYNNSRIYAKEHGIAHTKKQKIKTDNGTEEIDTFDYCEQDDKDEYRIIFVDHLSLVNVERGLTLKQSMDKLSEYFVILRNKYNFTIVAVQQQALSICILY